MTGRRLVTRRDCLASAAAVLAAGCASRAPVPPSLDELIARHTAASGGAAAIEAVRDAAYEIDIGVLRSFGGGQHDAADGRWLQTSVVTALRQNIVLDEAMFEMGAMPDR